MSSLSLFVGVPGGPELIIVVAIFVLLFGASRVPKVARSLGSATGEFKKGRKELEQELEDVSEELNEMTSLDSDTETKTETERSN